MPSYRKSIKITKNIRLNIGKKTISLTFVNKAFTLTINSKGRISTSHNIPEIVKEALKKENEASDQNNDTTIKEDSAE